MKKIFKVILIFTGVFLLVISKDSFRYQILGRKASAAGGLTVDWGVPAGQPLFDVLNFLPGDEEQREITIENGTDSVQSVGVRSLKTSEIGALADVLEMTISQNGVDLYGGSLGVKTLSQFFNDSAGPDGLFLFNLNPAESRKVKFSVKFLESAGNEFQQTSVVFDLVIGASPSIPEIPQECRHLRFDKIIYGTSRRDILHGTNGNDLIFGLEGNDEIEGSNGNDCLVGGDGNDRIYGSNGNDVILGGLGNDYLDASNGSDLVKGGAGNDEIEGSNGEDRIFGEEGNDEINAGNGNDYVEGGGGEDTMRGGNGNDILLGGSEYDIARGDLGNDRCEAEKKYKCEY